MALQCIKCKGANPEKYCGKVFCPVIAKANARFKVKQGIEKDNFFGASPAPFVGRFGYPNINLGLLSPMRTGDDVWEYDAPKWWAQHNYDIDQVLNFRSELVNSRDKVHIRDEAKLIEIGQDVAMSSKPVDVEVKLKQKPKFRVQLFDINEPMGPNAELEKVNIAENPKIDTRVWKVFDDTDLKAANALGYLYKKGFDENFLQKILSVGTLGVKFHRKLVPTRWSITATDDTLGKMLYSEIMDYNEHDFAAYFGDYLGNYYLILIMPGPWSYELFEMYMPKASFNPTEKVQYSSDFEFHKGRKTYAENCTGGYYTVRLAILEKMKQLKKKGTCIVLRFITGEYALPLGVWVTREASRKTMQNKPIFFEDKELLLKYAKALIKKKFGYDIQHLLDDSKILKFQKHQKTLGEFFG